MANKLPWIFSGSKVCIICEGDEEYEYLDKLISLDVWNENYKFTLENAEGNGNIPARYQDKYQNGSYDVVLVFCDTDRKPYEQYVDIKRKINEFHGVENAADKVVIYGNPITKENYLEMKERIKKLPSDDTIKGSSNFGHFIECFSMKDDAWIKDINDSLEE